MRHGPSNFRLTTTPAISKDLLITRWAYPILSNPIQSDGCGSHVDDCCPVGGGDGDGDEDEVDNAEEEERLYKNY